MRTCRAIGCKPYLAADLRALPARDFYQEIEYCNAPAGDVPSNSAAKAVPNALAAQRAANGDAAPFDVDLWGVGNESWGCGGNMSPEEYATEFRRYTAWTPSYSKTPLRFVAVGPNGDDVDWTTRLFKALYANPERRHLWGLSVHYYTSGSATKFAQGDALKFNNDEFYDLLTRGSIMERVVTDHWRAMRVEEGQPRVKLVVDEWGAWYGKGTEIGAGVQPVAAVDDAGCAADGDYAGYLSAPCGQGGGGECGAVDQLHSLADAGEGRQVHGDADVPCVPDVSAASRSAGGTCGVYRSGDSQSDGECGDSGGWEQLSGIAGSFADAGGT